jgi:ferredoxin
MPDPQNRIPENADGAWYVDLECIDCDLCRQEAPGNFTRSAEKGYSYVSKQPETDDEQQACEEAMEGCPVEAIGHDG